MGILPLQYQVGQNADVLKLKGTESLSIILPSKVKPKQLLNIQVRISLLFGRLVFINLPYIGIA